jgi:HK97 family phage major capsid protein
MMSDAAWKTVQKLKDSANAPLISQYPTTAPRVFAPGVQGDLLEPVAPVTGTLLGGYPVYINNDLAVPAASAKSILFGDFSKYVVRDVVGNDVVNDVNGGSKVDVSGALMLRFTDSAYVRLGQVGFLVFCRSGGNLLDANAVKYYQHSAT